MVVSVDEDGLEVRVALKLELGGLLPDAGLGRPRWRHQLITLEPSSGTAKGNSRPGGDEPRPARGLGHGAIVRTFRPELDAAFQGGHQHRRGPKTDVFGRVGY